MGNKVFKEFQEKPIGKGSMSGDEKYLLSTVLDTETSFFQKVKGMTGKTSEYINADTEEVVFKGKSTFTGKKSIIYDKDDNFLIFLVSKIRFKKNMMWIYKATPMYDGQPAADEKLEKDDDTPLYLVARLDSKDTMTTAKCSIDVVVGEDKDDESGFKYDTIMTAYKISTAGFNVYIEDNNGICVGKCTPKAKMSFEPKITVAAGVDPGYIMTAIMAVAPGGGSAGGLAGAGVV